MSWPGRLERAGLCLGVALRCWGRWCVTSHTAQAWSQMLWYQAAQLPDTPTAACSTGINMCGTSCPAFWTEVASACTRQLCERLRHSRALHVTGTCRSGLCMSFAGDCTQRHTRLCCMLRRLSCHLALPASAPQVCALFQLCSQLSCQHCLACGPAWVWDPFVAAALAPALHCTTSWGRARGITCLCCGAVCGRLVILMGCGATVVHVG